MTTPFEGQGVKYDWAQICLQGHLINPSSKRYPGFNKNFCTDCGAKTIQQCPQCSAGIRGSIEDDLSTRLPPVPSFCHDCGAQHPWVAERINAARELSDELEELSSEERDILKKSLDEIVKNTPRAVPSALKFKKIMTKVNKETVNTMTGVIKAVVVEAAKKIIWP